MPRSRARAILVVLALGVASLAACGDDEPDRGGTTTAAKLSADARLTQSDYQVLVRSWRAQRSVERQMEALDDDAAPQQVQALFGRASDAAHRDCAAYERGGAVLRALAPSCRAAAEQFEKLGATFSAMVGCTDQACLRRAFADLASSMRVGVRKMEDSRALLADTRFVPKCREALHGTDEMLDEGRKMASSLDGVVRLLGDESASEEQVGQALEQLGVLFEQPSRTSVADLDPRPCKRHVG
ncbi:hypothetical protein SK069_19250 [Patulibacter brassicae]|uniref:Lipoprotein n=1 Tax=Patulibacter brassicae TaxID=1705717 RepID=A0ABU4VPG5_9ACTN|nr:hypothetical protein [Patulibacter brassicae]MDX8153742.1 hypothetical protein [Patulibacter brassicae]